MSKSTRKDFETQEPLLPLHIEIGARREHEQREEDRMLYFPVNICNIQDALDAVHSQPWGDDEYPVYVASSANGDFQPRDGMLLGFLEGEALRQYLPTTARFAEFWTEFAL